MKFLDLGKQFSNFVIIKTKNNINDLVPIIDGLSCAIANAAQTYGGKMKLITTLILLISAKLYAYPTLYPERIPANIRNYTNSSYISDSENQRQMYVLPPTTSYAKVKGLHTVTANVGFCKEISNLQKYNADTVDLINSMKTKDSFTKSLLEEKNTKLAIANEELSKYIVANNMQELASLDMRTVQIEKRLDELYVKYKNCSNDCIVLNKDIQDSQMLKMELTTRRFELSSANLVSANEYERKKAYAQGLKSNVEDLQTNWKKIQADLKDLYVDFNRMYDAHAKREGGRAAISYDSLWTENIQRLRRDNPGYIFEKIQTKNVSISATAYSKNNLLPEGAVLSFDVAGMAAGANLQMGGFPDSFSGNAVLSLLAVCPMLHPEWFDATMGTNIQDMTYGITANYEYPAVMKYGVTVHYNMYRMYELIKSQGTSGGFFSSSSWSDQSEQEFFRESFSVEWDDKNQVLSFDKKLAISSDLRKQMLSRLAGYLVMNNQGARLSMALDLPNTGAMVLSNSLNQACPINIYCKGASIAFGVMQAIFGSSSTEQSLRQITDVNMTDRYSDLQIVMQPMTTTYK